MRSGKCSRNGIRSAVSGGAALPVAFATATASVGAMVQGAAIGMNAIDNLKNDKGRVNASFTENTGRGSNHLNQTPKHKVTIAHLELILKQVKQLIQQLIRKTKKNLAGFKKLRELI